MLSAECGMVAEIYSYNEWQIKSAIQFTRQKRNSRQLFCQFTKGNAFQFTLDAYMVAPFRDLKQKNMGII